jgi:hypothetical protein
VGAESSEGAGLSRSDWGCEGTHGQREDKGESGPGPASLALRKARKALRWARVGGLAAVDPSK